MKIIPFITKVSWTVAGSIIYAFTQFMILSVLAKFGGPEDVGMFTLSLAMCSPIFLFLNLKLRSVIATDFNDEYHFFDYEGLRKITSIFAIFLIIIVISFAGYDKYISTTIILFSIAKFFEMKSEVYYGFFQKKQLFELIAKSVILRGLTNLILVFLFFGLTKNLMWAILGIALTNFFVHYFYDKRNIEKFIKIDFSKRKVNYKNIKLIFLLSFPLGLSTLIGSLNTNIPRYIIENKLGLYELGIFSGLAYLLFIGNTLLSSVSQVLMPKLVKFNQDKDYRSFKRVVFKMVLFGFFVSVLMVLIFNFFGEIILTIIYSQEYVAYKNILMVLVMGISVLYSSVFLGTAITALKMFKIQPYIHSLSLLFLTISSILLIDEYKLIGMAWSLVIGYLVTSIGYLFSIIYFIKQNKKEVKQFA
ncbi:oligosaccharide flippase family protein [Peribacillus sp. TH27]|uniref:oligosaccharide flippase family protein n=1 Tax=Peribacillus sp. TH27 TaxID=2798484 RepID=UPI001911CB28|nr:oligosaccharide flippase family protein [Peribacillus sp. TH27]MBK5462547.1 oligosaccharide flippase family protein [Peribacillus sp. TH27]